MILYITSALKSPMAFFEKMTKGENVSLKVATLNIITLKQLTLASQFPIHRYLLPVSNIIGFLPVIKITPNHIFSGFIMFLNYIELLIKDAILIRIWIMYMKTNLRLSMVIANVIPENASMEN